MEKQRIDANNAPFWKYDIHLLRAVLILNRVFTAEFGGIVILCRGSTGVQLTSHDCLCSPSLVNSTVTVLCRLQLNIRLIPKIPSGHSCNWIYIHSRTIKQQVCLDSFLKAPVRSSQANATCILGVVMQIRQCNIIDCLDSISNRSRCASAIITLSTTNTCSYRLHAG